jgi:AcrR family transcriptional regulator
MSRAGPPPPPPLPDAPLPPAPPSPPPAPIEPLTPERRRQQTREHLLEAAGRVFAERGFHGASIDALAAAAGFTKGAVYSNFKDKDDLFLALLDERTRREFEVVKASLAELEPLSQEETTDRWVRLTAEMLWGDRDWYLLDLEFVLYAARNEDARRKLAERQRTAHARLVPIIAAELESMEPRSDLSPDELASIFISLFNGIALRHTIDPELSGEALVETAIKFVMQALESDNPS